MFDYQRPSTVDEALGLLQHYGDRAMLIAGGTDVMVGIRRKKFSPEILVSLKGIDGLDYVEPHQGGARIGAMATHRQIGESPFIRRTFAALTDGVDRVGSLQIRNVATIGGNVANGLPSADSACPLLVFDTQVRIKGVHGERTLPLGEFYTGPGRTILQRDEILLEFIIPAPPPASVSSYWKHARRKAMEITMLGVAMMLAVDVKDATPIEEALSRQAPLDALLEALDRSVIYCREARIALGVAAPTPMRASDAETMLEGKRLDTQILRAAGRAASEEAHPRDSMRGSAWYRKKMIEVLPRRIALTCLQRLLLPAEQEGPGR